MGDQLPATTSSVQQKWTPINNESEPRLNPGTCLGMVVTRKITSAKGNRTPVFQPLKSYCRLRYVISFLHKSAASVCRQGWSSWITISLWRIALLSDVHYRSLEWNVVFLSKTDWTVQRSSRRYYVTVCTFSCPHFFKNFVLWKQYRGK